MKKTLLFLISFFFVSQSILGQSISAGDLAIIGVSVDDEEVLLVALAEIPAGESVFFTDEEWNGSSFNSGEGFYEWITPSISAGTTFTLTKTSVSAGGTVTQRAGSMIFSNSGDGFFLYQTSDNVYNTGTYSLIGFAGEDSGDSGTLSNTGLTEGTNAIYFGGDNGIYTGTRASNDKAGHLSNIYDSSNWATSGSAQTFVTTNFIMSGGGAGMTLSANSGTTDEDGSQTTFTVVLNSEPSSNVVLDINSSDTSENTVSPSSLTFTSADWDTAQTVTVTGVDDQVSDGDIVSTVTISVDDANSDDDYDSVLDETFSVTNDDNDFTQLIISEIMYNSIDGFGSDDEWVEIYNNNGATVDLSDFTLSNSSNHIDFTFPSGSEISDGEYITVAFGSNGDGIFNLFNPFTPDYNAGVKSSGSLVQVSEVAETEDTNHAYNTTSTITIINSSGTTIDTVYYSDSDVTSTDGDGSSYEIVSLSAVNSNTDTNWQASANTGGSPGVINSQSGDADTTGQTLDIGGSGDISLSSNDLSIVDLSVAVGGSLTIERNSSVTISNDFSNSGTITLNSDSNEFASLIVSGTATGEITYNRYVNTEGSGEWDLIGPLVDGLDMTTFINDNSSLASQNDFYAIGSYDNSTNEWTNYTLATANGNNVELGVGYQMATDSGTTLAFTGDVAITDQTTSIINNDGNGSGRRWNLVANPYPSYLNINSAADATDNFLTVNLAAGNENIDSEYAAVYGWNADGTGYSSYDNNDTAKYMAPGQGFFVAASGSVNLDFTTAMRTVSGGDDFIAGDVMEFPEVYLNLYNEDVLAGQTHVRFRDNMTLGLNPSYDVGSYDQNAAITTRLVEDDQGTNFEHQNLPINAIQNVTIPLVINQSAGQEFKVNLHTSTIYDSNVYLEDAEEGTFTNLNEVDFSLTPTSDLSGAGRFFIHITADTMSNEDVSTSMLNAYKEINVNHITIEGLATQSNNINVSLYNILGTKVLDTSLSNNMNTQTISTAGLESGIYVIELESGNDRLTKKLIIK